MRCHMIFLAAVAFTANLFGDVSSPYRCKMSGNELEADIIVIGGGAAGCIVMNKLSEGGQFSVLGIEGGLNLTDDPAIEAVGLPAFLLAGTGKYKYFWPGWNQSVPMPGLNGRTSDWTTGMLLGGGSSINGLYYGRGSNNVYARWEAVSGSSNWSLSHILATFEELENYQGLTITPGARGDDGAVNILQTPTISQVTSQVLLPATQAAFPGIPTVVDYNDPTVSNCIAPQSQWFINPTSNKRVSSATAYLNSSVMTRAGQGVNGHKLFMLFDAVATKILFDKHGRAKKVRYVKDGKQFEAKARKGVVIASGINSSKLLQLSGIGPTEVLKNAGVKPVYINENVGKHLQNHPLIFITMLADPALNGVPINAEYAFTIHSVYLPVPGTSASDPRMLQMLFEYIPGDIPLIAFGFNLLNPVSEGSVNIQSDNSFQIAAADDGFYQDPVDLEHMKSAVSVYVRDLLAQFEIMYPFPSPYFRPILSDPINLVILDNYSDSSLEQYVKNNSNLSLDIHHFVSHCKMAPLAAGGVVDGDTRVYGTKNVFVVDNSICPVIPDINTTGPAMMIGLRSSEIIKRALRNEKSE
jgi:choline dehydrogenase